MLTTTYQSSALRDECLGRSQGTGFFVQRSKAITRHKVVKSDSQNDDGPRLAVRRSTRQKTSMQERTTVNVSKNLVRARDVRSGTQDWTQTGKHHDWQQAKSLVPATTQDTVDNNKARKKQRAS